MPLHPVYSTILLSLFVPASFYVSAQDTLQNVIAGTTLSINSIPSSTRAFWMRRANAAISTLR